MPAGRKRKYWWKRFKFTLGAGVGPYLLHSLFLFSKNQFINYERYTQLRDSDRSVILVLWHGQMLAPIYMLRDEGIHTMVGYHRDAEMIARVLKRLGYFMIRGSSRDRGKEALEKGLALASDSTNTIAITTDGPLGPYRQCKPGAARISQEKQAVVLPLASNSSRKKIIRNSWDQFYLPLPYGHNIVIFGEPIYPERITGNRKKDTLTATLQQIESHLHRLQNEADQYFQQ